jgi:hypothetical protein
VPRRSRKKGTLPFFLDIAPAPGCMKVHFEDDMQMYVPLSGVSLVLGPVVLVLTCECNRVACNLRELIFGLRSSLSSENPSKIFVGGGCDVCTRVQRARHQLAALGFTNAPSRACASFLFIAPTPRPSPLPRTPFPGNSKPLLCRLQSRYHLVEISFALFSKLRFGSGGNVENGHCTGDIVDYIVKG